MTATPHRVKPGALCARMLATADRNADPHLGAVLLAKAPTDDVPLAVWWLLAESLRHSVRVRRTIEYVEILEVAELCLEASRAGLYAEAALEEIDERPVESVTVEGLFRKCSSLPASSTVRATTCDLARLIVTSRAVTSERLRPAIIAHLDALRLAVQ
jgi:hypothetical protein